MLRRKCSQGKCSQGTLTQSKRHIMARVNHLQKHLLSHCSINLCTWWILLALSAAGRELQVTSAFCPRQPADSSSPPAVCAGQHCLCLREEDVFCLPYKHHSDNAVSFPHGPLPPVPKFPLLSPSFPRTQDHTSHPWPCHLSATAQTLGLCSHSHQGPLCPLYSCRRKGWIKKMWNYTGTAAKSPPDRSPHHCLAVQGHLCRARFLSQAENAKKIPLLNLGGVEHKKQINNICSS